MNSLAADLDRVSLDYTQLDKGSDFNTTVNYLGSKCNVMTQNTQMIVLLSKTIEIRFVLLLRDEFAKSGQDQTRSGFPKFVTENGWLRVDRGPQSLPLCWARPAAVAAVAQGRGRQPFSLTNLGNPCIGGSIACEASVRPK